ncbi:MAG: hypothetical protein ACK40G_00375 [Cytophagaceae bacterium]
MKAKLFYSLLLISLLFISCRRDKEVQPFDPNTLVERQGVISGTLNGTRRDNTNFSHNFTANVVEDNRFTEDGGVYDILIGRSDYGFPMSDLGTRFYVDLPEYTNQTTRVLSGFDFDIQMKQDMGNNTIFEFYMGAGETSNATMSMTNITFDPQTGRFTADFSAAIPANENTTGRIATITNGKIDVNLKRYVMRKGQ